MKYVLSITFILISLIGLSQANIEKTIGEFSTLKVYDLINVEMIKSKENKVVISGKNKDDVTVVNKNGKLKIRMNIGESFDGNKTDVKLYYTSIEAIDANEGAEITVNDLIKQYEIELKTQEGGKITAEVKTTYTYARAVTGGIINLSGSSDKQEVTIYTGGKFNAEDFKTEVTKINVNAGGNASIYASEIAKVKVRAGGDIKIYGNPKEIDEKRVLGGRVKRM